MYSLITGCLKWVNAKEEVQVLMVGLPQSGKTTLIEQMYSIWDRYYGEADALIFVVDASDRGRFPEAKARLGEVLSHPGFSRDAPVLLVANKTDVPGAATTTEVLEEVWDGASRAAGLGGGSSVVVVSGGAGSTASSGGGGSSGRRVYACLPAAALLNRGVEDALAWAVARGKEAALRRGS